MILVAYKGKKYRLSYGGGVEVLIPAGEPRVMRDAKREYWRTLKANGPTAVAVRKVSGR